MLKRPPFLKGAFQWTARGYFYAGSPPMDLLKPAALTSEDPWIVIAAAVEHAKLGDHSHIRLLKQWFYEIPQSIAITGDAGTEADLRTLAELMHDESADVRASACEAAMMAGRLWLVPFMLEAYRRATHAGDRETIGYAISDLLDEQAFGEIASLVGSPSAPAVRSSEIQNPLLRALAEQQAARADDEPTFEPAVETRFDALRAQFGGDQLSIWRGKPFSVRALAAYLLSLVRNPSGSVPAESFYVLRQKFEAATGIDCSAFFKDGVLQPLAVAAIAEDFLESGRPDTFRDGQRHFFAHIV
jgi:hypothetical protein